MEKKQKILFMLIATSSIVLLILLFLTVLILRSEGTDTSERVRTLPNESVTPTLTVLTPKGPASEEAGIEADYPFELEGAIPEELWMDISNDSVDGYKSFDMTLQGDDSFTIIITTLSADPETTSTERVKYQPPQYAYAQNEFVRIATVNGQELYVSRTGASGLEEASNEGRLVSQPQMTDPDISYYVYQRYPFGLSEYITAFNTEDRTEPDFDNHTIIRYGFTDQADADKWQIYQPLIQETITGLSRD